MTITPTNRGVARRRLLLGVDDTAEDWSCAWGGPAKGWLSSVRRSDSSLTAEVGWRYDIFFNSEHVDSGEGFVSHTSAKEHAKAAVTDRAIPHETLKNEPDGWQTLILTEYAAGWQISVYPGPLEDDGHPTAWGWSVRSREGELVAANAWRHLNFTYAPVDLWRAQARHGAKTWIVQHLTDAIAGP